MSTESRSVVVRLSMEASQYIREAQAAGTLGENAMQRVERATTKADAAQAKMGRTAKMVGFAIGAGLAYVTKAAVDWESQWTGVTKTVDGSARQLNQLQGELRDLAKTMPESHQEIAAVAEAAGQLGVKTPDVAEFTKVMVELGETTNLTSDQAATSIAQIENVMGTAADETDNFAASLVALGNNGASTEAQILEMANRIAATGAQVGLTEADILGLANAAASMGIDVEAGGSAISRVFQTMAKDVAKGGADLELFAQVAGVSSKQFARDFQNDPARAFAAFTEGLDRINKAGGDVFSVLDQLGLSDIRVSQALLSMAASGDYLTNSLDLSAQAWDQNSALANEFAERMGTDASQVQIAINNVRDAAIDFGATMLPIVSDIAQGVSTVAQAFGSLPAPLQAVITKAVALTLVVGGAGWFGVKSVAAVKSMNATLVTLGITADTTRGKIALAGAQLTSVLITANLMQEAFNKIANTQISGGSLNRDLQSLADGKTTENLSNLFHVFQDSQNKWQRDWNPLSWVSSWDPSGFESAEKSIKSLDESLASLVESGQAETAAAAFDQMSQTADKAGLSTKEFAALFPEYKTALDNAASSSEDQAAATEQSTAAIAAQRQALEENIAQLQAQRDAARQTADSFIGLGDSLNDSKVSLDQWIQDMADQAKALRDFEHNAKKAADNGINKGLIAALRKAGPEGALRLEQLANAHKDEARKANAAWRAQQAAANDYVDAVAGVGEAVDDLPTQHQIKIIAQTDPARAEVLSFKSWLASQNLTKTVRLITERGPGPQVSTYADGGFTGWGGKYEPAGIVHRGEVVIPQDRVRRDWGLLKARYGDLPGFAGGGVVGSFGDSGASQGLDKLRIAAQKSSDTIDKERKAREEAARQRRQELSSTVAGNFRSDIFGGGTWGAGDPLSILRGDISQARAYKALIGQLRHRGLNGNALAQIQTLDQAQLLAGMSDRDLREYERLFRIRQRVSAGAGDAAASAAYGRAAQEQVHATRAVAEQVRQLRAEIRVAAEEAGQAFGREINGTARRGVHNRRHPGV